jgi:hypothetical protein
MTFRSATAVILWVLWLLFAVGNWIDLAVQGRDHGALVAAAILLLVTGIGYVTAQRPRVIADDAGITVRNPLRDHRIGWPAITRVDLADLLRIHCDWGQGTSRRIVAWAVHYSRRRQLSADIRGRRNARRAEHGGQGGYIPFGRGWPYASTPAQGSSEEADALRTVRILSELTTRDQNAPKAPPASTWSWPAVAALVVPALILLVVCLLP